MSYARWLSVGVTVLACVVAAPAFAQGDGDRGRAAEAYRQGVAAHERGDAKTAAEAFARADAIAPAPAALKAALDASVDADDPALGAELLERAAKRGPAGDALARSVETATRRFAGRAGQVKVACPEGATCLATIDGAPLDVGAARWVRTGQHTVVVQVDGEPETKIVVVGATDTLVVAPAPRPAAAPSSPAPASTAASAPAPDAPPPPASPRAPSPAPVAPASAGLSPTVFFVFAGATLAAGGASTVLALRTQSKHDAFVDAGCDRADAAGCADLQDDGRSRQHVTNVALAITGALALTTAVVGVVLTDWKRGGKAATSPAAFAVPLPGGGVAGWSGRF